MILYLKAKPNKYKKRKKEDDLLSQLRMEELEK